VLPEDPVGFAFVVAIGAILFKIMEGQSITVHLDMLVLFCISCGLIGYRLAGAVPVEYIKGSVGESTPQDDTAATPQPTPLVKARPSLAQFRSSQAHNLLQASLRNFRSSVVGGQATLIEKSKQIIAAKTFPKFPDGAAIGSHLNCWSSPAANNFQVRGPNYLEDHKKVASGDFLFPTRGVDLFLTDNAPTNVGRNACILGGKLRNVPTFIINYRLPWGVFISYHEIPERFLPFLRRGNGYGDMTVPLPSTADMSPGERAVSNFLLSDSEEKDAIWKMVPVVVEGPWVVKRVVGGKPAIIGSKLPISYVYQPPQPEHNFAEYFEADLDIVSSAAARNILAVVRSYTQTLTIDLGFVVQGNTKEELPEQMMLGLRLHGLDPLTAEMLPHFDNDDELDPLMEDDWIESSASTDTT
jgi:hypothetical protein